MLKATPKLKWMAATASGAARAGGFMALPRGNGDYTGVNIHRIDLGSDDHEIPEIPAAESDLHEETVNCWCVPDLAFADARDGRRMWRHKPSKGSK